MEAVLNQLRERGLLDAAAEQRARDLLAQGQHLEEALLAADGLTEEQILKVFSDLFGVPCIELENYPVSKELLAAFPVRLLVQHQILPLEQRENTVLVATSRVFDTTAIDELRLACGKDCQAVLAPSKEIQRLLKQHLGIGADTIQTLSTNAEADLQVIDAESEDDLDLSNAAQDASIIKFVNQVLTEAIDMRATDVHIEPFEDQLRLRYRIDGVLQHANAPASVRRFQAAIVSRIKILSHLDIAEKRLPQDGRIKIKISGREIDVRVSIIPMLHGEAVVLRILDRSDALLGTEYLGMSDQDRTTFNEILELPHGIVLVTGPTGSGKTTTLYAALSKINDIERKIITIEDPVEYQLRGINQIQVNTKSGLTFATGLRSILRHDPDVVLIGEIRDRETAEIAVQASLTGHLVFSTLHTNDAPGAATRLIDMGVEPYLVASSLEMVLAQRLVRLICNECKEPLPEKDATLLRSQFGALLPPVLYRGRGCRHCQGTGYRGRTGVFEIMPISEPIRELILRRESAGHIRKAAAAAGMRNLREDGWRLVREGRTTVEEVLRNTKYEAGSVYAGTAGGTGVEPATARGGA